MTTTRARRRREERGAEAVAMIFVIPVLVILVLALIDVGMMFRTRMLVENVARDTVRSAAADGGLNNPRTNTIGKSWVTWGRQRLYKDNKCVLGGCEKGRPPTMTCYNMDGTQRYTGNVVEKAGDLVVCEINYPYEGINDELLSSPIGLGFGTMLKDFRVKVSARSETGDKTKFGN